MKKIENELKEILKNISGNILLIGNYSNNIENLINQNKNIIFCDQLTNNSNNKTSNKTKKNKKINIKKIKKHYKKNKINNTIVNYQEIKEYKKTFIKDSTFITKNNIIVIDKNNEEEILNMYKRYSEEIQTINCLDGKIYIINSSKIKNNIIKDLFYLIYDTFIDIIEIITNIL